jgi:hypothetical protein
MLCTCILLLLGCANRIVVTQAKLGQEFSLVIGQTVAITDEDLKIKFIEVIEDSRCQTGVYCFWAGRVTCIVEFTIKNADYKMALTEPGLTSDYTNEIYENYQLKFRIEPYPQAGKTINKSDYRLLLMISK